jgi:hypothetical protein
MTPLFVPGVAAGDATRQAHDALRGYVEASSGHMTRDDVIFALRCRRAGEDSEARVGELDPYARQIVLAIFASRDGYSIVWDGGYADVTRRQTYQAIPFD